MKTGGPGTAGPMPREPGTGLAAGQYSPAQLARLLGAAEPTAEQAAVIGAPLRPLAVIAGAGSGKSETMAARLVWLVAGGLVRPERVLGLTFTRKAAAELSGRVRSRLDGLRRAGRGCWQDEEDLLGDPVIATYHSYAGRLVADHALREALEPSLRLITPAIAWQLAARVVAAYDGPMDAIGWAPATVTAAVLDLSGELAEHLRGPGDVIEAGEWLARRCAELPGRVPALTVKILKCQRAREQLLPLVSAYVKAKAAREVLDYGDQMAVAARIAQRHPAVGAAERARYQAVLLDEYQDTSHAQLVLLRSLFGGGHPVTAVGDPCQSIYGWRGATAGNLRRFSVDFPAREGPSGTALLSTSFRNTGRVLDAAAALQEGLRAAAPEVPRLIAPPDRDQRGEVTCALLETSAQEADWVAARVAGLLSLPPGIAPDGGRWPGGGNDAVRPSDIAVLCRKRAQFAVLRAALEASGIPVEVVGLGGLLTVPEVADIVATLRVMHDPSAADALARVLTSPRWRIGPRDLVALGRRSRALASGADQPPRAAARPAAASPAPAPAPGPVQAPVPAASPAPAPAPAQAPAQAPAPAPASASAPDDVMDRMVTDLTADPGSLVEALDDPGDPAAYSAVGYQRLAALAAELRALRLHTGRTLPELVGEVERTLGLDIEVAARPGADPASARADLDAFADAAAAFAGDLEEPTLGAFLAYLAAAEAEEFGLEAGRVGETDSVKLATVHAAKGLQWAAVVVPGLSAGTQGHVFPAKPKVTTRWTENPRLLPFGLRGDAADLPVLAGLDAASLASFTEACADRELAEERRLAYVAATRAAFWLCCTGYWWGDGASLLGPSAFLTEVRAACEAGAGTVGRWAAEPEPDACNPAPCRARDRVLAGAAAGSRYEAAREAAALVTAEIKAQGRESHESAERAGAEAAGTGAGDEATGPAGDGDAAAERAGAGDAAAERAGAGDAAAGPAGAGDAAAGGAAEPARIVLSPRDAALIAGWSARRRPAARRASAAPQRPCRGRPASGPDARVLAGDDGQGTGRARRAGPAADATATRAAGAPRHGVPPLAGAAVRAPPAYRLR